MVPAEPALRGRHVVAVKRVASMILTGVGALALAAILAVVMLGIWGTRQERVSRPKDLVYILNWAGLDSSRIVEVRHAYVTPANPIVGDQTRAYCLKLDHPLRLAPSLEPDRVWVGPVSDSLLLEALQTATSFPADAGVSWFPNPADLNSGRFLLSFEEVTARHGVVHAVTLTAYDTRDDLLYHSEVKW